MKRIKNYTLCLFVALLSLFSLSACETEYDPYEQDYRYARQTLVGEWRVQEALLDRGVIMPYTSGSVLGFDDYGNYRGYGYASNNEERGYWRMERSRSDGRPYVRLEIASPNMGYDVVYAHIEQINDNYMRLYVEDVESTYRLILTRRHVGW